MDMANVKQEILEGTIDYTVINGLKIKQEEIDAKVEEVYIKDELLVTNAGLTYKLQEQLLKIDETKVATLDIKQETTAGTPDNGPNIKLEESDIKDVLLVTPAPSGSLSEDTSPSIFNSGVVPTGDVLENMMRNAKIFHSCSFCPYKTTSYTTSLNHKMTHTGEKPYSCSMCTYKAIKKHSLVIHMQTHTGEKPYACSVCEYRTTQKWKLAAHVKTHTGEKSYECSVCEHKTAEKRRLVLHMRTHTGEKPFSCSICDYKAARKYTLVRHLKTHESENPNSH